MSVRVGVPPTAACLCGMLWLRWLARRERVGLAACSAHVCVCVAAGIVLAAGRVLGLQAALVVVEVLAAEDLSRGGFVEQQCVCVAACTPGRNARGMRLRAGVQSGMQLRAASQVQHDGACMPQLSCELVQVCSCTNGWSGQVAL